MAKKILLAEDSVTMQKVVEMTFAAEDFTVTAVASAEEAIERAKEMKPDVVIADLSMDGKNGYDICSAIKSDPSMGSVQVLLLHGSATPVDGGKAKAAQADGDIAKPFETQAMIDKVKELTEKGALAKEAMGPVESLSPPIEAAAGGEDIVIDTDAFKEPEKPAVAKPAAAKPVAAKPAPKPAAPPPAAAKAAKPAEKPKPAPPKPPAKKPAPPPAAAKPAAKPAAPKPAAPKPALKPALAKQQDEPVEITIEAEPPPPREASQLSQLPSFEHTIETPIKVEPSVPAKESRTLVGIGAPGLAPEPEPPKEPPKEVIVSPPKAAAPAAPAKPGLPPPPAGMPLPPAAAAKTPPLKPGEPYEPVAYDAIAKLSKEIIERIAWEVVPDLAEQIIREELDRLVEKRRSS